MEKRKVAVAMSGGVDSGVAAALVVKAGYQAAGFHMKLWQEKAQSSRLKAQSFENKCCSTESLEAARKTAHQLGIPFYTVDLEKIFKKRVVDYFLKEYAAGQTPNPCVMCNKFIKFGELLDYIKKLGYDYLATGHYARIVNGHFVTNFSLMSARKNKDIPPNGGTSTQIRSKLSLRARRGSEGLVTPSPLHLLMGRDRAKDQSYFLYSLTQRQLPHVLFPVGDYTKKEVIAMAKKWKLPVAERPESQEICFFTESDYQPFLKRQIPKKIVPGEVVDTRGKVIGKHQGIPLYTIGQRHGFEVRADNKQPTTEGLIPPYYIVAKDAKKNRLIVGFGKEAERKEFWVKEVNWLNPNILVSQYPNILVRIRHQGELLSSKAQRDPDLASARPRAGKGSKKLKVVLDEAERGIAPGQAAVFYNKLKIEDCEVLGGGIIAIDRK